MDKRKVFHSSRQNFTTALHSARVDEEVIKANGGHERGFTLGTYARGGSALRTLKTAIDQVEYPGL